MLSTSKIAVQTSLNTVPLAKDQKFFSAADAIDLTNLEATTKKAAAIAVASVIDIAIRDSKKDEKPVLMPAPVQIPPSLSLSSVTFKDTVAYYSFDFDGSLFNRFYFTSAENKNTNLTETERFNLANLHLFKWVANQIQLAKYSDVVILSGSARQSQSTELFNAYPEYGPDRGLSFPKLRSMCAAISSLSGFNCTLDTSLLADFYNDKPAGESYQAAMKDRSEVNHSQYAFDDTKISLIYAQIHKAASENPNVNIVFNFFDDRAGGYNGILATLRMFFSENADLLPHNVSLHLHKYDGEELVTAWTRHGERFYGYQEELSNPNPIQGKGPIDYNYRETLKAIGKKFGNKEQTYMGQLLSGKEELIKLIHATRSELPAYSLDAKHQVPAFYKDVGKIKDLAGEASVSFKQNAFPPLITNKEYMLRVKGAKIASSINGLINQIEKEIPAQQAKHDSKFFSCCLTSEAVTSAALVGALRQLSYVMELYYGNNSSLTRAEANLLKSQKDLLTPLLIPYENDFSWLKDYIQHDKVKTLKP
jgi:hypothetical protein